MASFSAAMVRWNRSVRCRGRPPRAWPARDITPATVIRAAAHREPTRVGGAEPCLRTPPQQADRRLSSQAEPPRWAFGAVADRARIPLPRNPNPARADRTASRRGVARTSSATRCLSRRSRPILKPLFAECAPPRRQIVFNASHHWRRAFRVRQYTMLQISWWDGRSATPRWGDAARLIFGGRVSNGSRFEAWCWPHGGGHAGRCSPVASLAYEPLPLKPIRIAARISPGRQRVSEADLFAIPSSLTSRRRCAI